MTPFFSNYLTNDRIISKHLHDNYYRQALITTHLPDYEMLSTMDCILIKYIPYLIEQWFQHNFSLIPHHMYHYYIIKCSTHWPKTKLCGAVWFWVLMLLADPTQLLRHCSLTHRWEHSTLPVLLKLSSALRSMPSITAARPSKRCASPASLVPKEVSGSRPSQRLPLSWGLRGELYVKNVWILCIKGLSPYE